MLLSNIQELPWENIPLDRESNHGPLAFQATAQTTTLSRLFNSHGINTEAHGTRC